MSTGAAELFKIDEISNLDIDNEFKNVNKLIGGAKKKKDNLSFSNNFTSVKKNNNDNDNQNTKTINVKNMPDDMNSNDANDNANDDNNNSEKKTMNYNVEKENMNNKQITDIDDEDLLKETNETENNDESVKEEETNNETEKEEETNNEAEKEEGKNDEIEKEEEDIEDNNEKIMKENVLETYNSNNKSSSTMFNISEFRKQFYMMMLEGDHMNEEIDERLEILLPLVNDKNEQLKVLAKMHKLGMITM